MVGYIFSYRIFFKVLIAYDATMMNNGLPLTHIYHVLLTKSLKLLYTVYMD